MEPATPVVVQTVELQPVAAYPAMATAQPVMAVAPQQAMAVQPVAMAIPAVPQPEEPEEPVGPQEASVRSKLAGRPKLHKEQSSMLELAKLFDVIDVNDDKQISRDEFKKAIPKMELHRPEGAADGWKDDAFDKFDVDNQGSIDYTEFNFVLAQTLFSYHANGREDMTALECLKEVLGATQAAQTQAKDPIAQPDSGTKDEYEIEAKRKELALNAEVEELHAKTSEDEFQDSCQGALTVAVFPCYLCCCSPLGCASFSNGASKLVGLQSVVGYISDCKDTNPRYKWTIQNYHYETRTVTYTDNEGKTQTRTETVRVNTHYAATDGTLLSSDVSPVFVPNMRKRNCALGSYLSVEFDPAFKGPYERQKQMWYAANTTDTHQDKSEGFSLPGMRGSVRCEWADDGEEDPCWANGFCMVASVLTCTSLCWFLKMRNFMCADNFRFIKSAKGFAYP